MQYIKSSLTYIFVISICSLLLTACGGGSSSTTDTAVQPTTHTEPVPSNDEPSLADLEFTLRSSCARYDGIGEGDEDSWFKTWGATPQYLEVHLVEDDGTRIDRIYRSENPSLWGGGYAGHTFNGWAIHTGREEYEFRSEQLRNNIDKNLLITCRHQQVSNTQEINMFIPLRPLTQWEKTIKPYDEYTHNGLFFEVSLLTDLNYELYLAHYKETNDKEAALAAASSLMERNFPDGLYKSGKFEDYDSRDDMFAIRSEYSVQLRYYKLLKRLADTYTNTSVTVLNEAIGLNYTEFYLEGNHHCTERIFCATFFPEYTEEISQNSSFTEGNGLDNWILYERHNGVSTGAILPQRQSTYPSKFNIELTLASSHGEGVGTAQLEIYQEYEVTQGELDAGNLFFAVDSIKILGDCEFIFGCISSSGMAGYYICFMGENNTQLGCIILSDHTDAITIPIYVGEIFNIESTPSMSFLPASSSNFSAFLDIGHLMQTSLPAVRENRHSIERIAYGAFVAEVSSDGMCADCVAELEVEKIALYKIKEW